MRRRTISFITSLAIALLCLSGSLAHAARELPQDQSKAVILAYFEVGGEGDPDNSITTEQFTAQLQEIESGAYNVIALPDALAKIQNGEALPPRTLVITLDGAYKSAALNAIPALLEKKLPFTIFYASESLDAKSANFMSWDDLKKLSTHKNITIGVLPSTFDHIARKSDTEILASLNKARQRHREMLGVEADYLSYPFGEYSLDLKKRAQTQGFKAALGTRSGAIYQGEDQYALPRFTMTERYGDLDRFRMVGNALPLPVTDVEPADPYIKSGEWFSGFTLPAQLADDTESLSCFLFGMPVPDIQKLGPRVEIRSTAPTEGLDRVRLNCTMNGPKAEDDSEQVRWFGMLYHRAGENNNDVTENMDRVTDVTGSPPDELPEPQE